MTTLQRLGMSAFVAAGLVATAPIHAATVNLSADLSAPVSVTAGTPTTTTSVNGSVDVSGSVNTDASTDANASASATATAEADEVLTVGRGDVSENDVTVVSADVVTTSTSLSAYAKGVIKSDENVSKVEVQDDEVSLWYKQPAKFLGFIPTSLAARAIVRADGSVDVKYPWYSFLTAHGDADLVSDLDLAAGTIARAESTTEFSASAKARLIDAMARVMKSHYEASTTTEVSGTANLN
jgi:hypothetical protein